MIWLLLYYITLGKRFNSAIADISRGMSGSFMIFAYRKEE